MEHWYLWVDALAVRGGENWFHPRNTCTWIDAQREGSEKGLASLPLVCCIVLLVWECWRHVALISFLSTCLFLNSVRLMLGLLSMRCLITFPLKFKRLRGSKFVSLCKQHDIVVDLISHGIRTVWWDISYRFLNASIIAASMESVQKYLTWIFPGKTNKTWKASSSEKVRGIFMLTSIYKFICCQKTALATGSPPVWESVYSTTCWILIFSKTQWNN